MTPSYFPRIKYYILRFKLRERRESRCFAANKEISRGREEKKYLYREEDGDNMKQPVLLAILLTAIATRCEGKPRADDEPQTSGKALMSDTRASLNQQKMKERCLAVPFNQTVHTHKKHCDKVLVANQYCVGQCASFYVPMQHATRQTCSGCLPNATEEREVVLRCRNHPQGFITKKIIIVKGCQCQEGDCDDQYK